MYRQLFEAKFENVGESISLAQAHLAAEGIDESLTSMCMLALSEAINNVVEHSYPEDIYGSVELNIEISDESILFRVKDCGRSPPPGLFLGPKEMPDPLSLPEGGWGLALISSVMDGVYFSSDKGYNQLELTKHRSAEPISC